MKKKIAIQGMSCNHCVNHVIQALEDLGATDVEVSLEKKNALAEFGYTTDSSIKCAIADAGYEVVGIQDFD